ncbi:hypothetical protein SNOG_10959 [Parastagonospora nodorum SN15]|uniref:Methyltransferase type 11 domain-containing protein n=1 Tax=Phaeosphaeria nodorum (strain SN15 / ATCC MYA-4574 / FGSC 10173) TaxID=321614 RepID=Q0UBA5_PHANO|nr:hypothetical protein SNOG_10959 [Parastagonospora nodorum SN15]EAT81458.2 hypothetical protein SNOG_10959 [Parastagonospora nodorum SN15]
MATHESDDLASTTASNELEPGLIAPLEPDSNIDTGSDFDDGDSAIESVSQAREMTLASSTASIRDELIKEVKEHGRSYSGYMEATDAHPETEVLGVDLAPVQPHNVPPNLNFEIDDLEQDWTFSRKFNYIHSQMMIGAFSDWPRYISQCFNFLETDGYLEVHDIDLVIKCDDGSLPTNSALVRWHNYMHDGASKAGFPLDRISYVPEMMRKAGFVDIVSVPHKWPINTWPKDKKFKELGKWVSFCGGIEGGFEE